MLPVTQIDTFYNGLTLRHRDTINAAAGGTFMKRRPKECYDLIENMTAHHNDWDTLAHKGELSSSITSSSSELAALTQQMAEIRKDMLQIYRSNQRPQGVLLSNTIPNPRADLKVITTRNGMTLARPSVPPLSLSSSKEVERDPETIMDQVLTKSTIRVPSLVVQPSLVSGSSELPPAPDSSSFVIPEKNPHQPLIPYPSRLNKEKLQDKSDIQIHSFLQMFKKLHFNISFLEALAYMPKYAKMVKDHLTNKEKLLELVNTLLNENCAAFLLKKLPEKLGDTGRFLIPCEFQELESCMALADLGASINLVPLSVWKKLILPELTLTRMTLELATRTVAYPAGIAEDVFMKVGKSTFPAYFVVVDYDIDTRVPIILGRPFLRTAHALIDIHGEELTPRVGDEKLVFNVGTHLENILKIMVKNRPTPSSDPVVESLSSSFTPFEDSDFLLEETDAFLSLDDSIPPGIDNGIYDSGGDPLDLELKDLPPHLEYVFLEGTSKLPVIIAKDLKREEKE
ncbi:reverse transcriptase domain-containing protein [Tanacetum coccineum]